MPAIVFLFAGMACSYNTYGQIRKFFELQSELI